MAPAAHEISRTELGKIEPSVKASITNVEHLSSYNWIEAPVTTPTIAVPGSPALWSVPRVPRRLQKDSGLIYIAQNAARHPESPLEPLFRALWATCPSFNIQSVDVITDRNNMRKLLSFIDPSSAKGGLEAFTINIEIQQNTAIFCRSETKTSEYIGPEEFRGFGHAFEQAYTVSQISGSTGHHRIVSYHLGDLKFLVRHETDGYVNTDTRLSSTAKPQTGDSLSNMLETLSLSPAKASPGITVPQSKLTIQQKGQKIPLTSTLEIKTRVFHKPLEICEVAAQLWISQTPKLVRAYHRNGTFQTPVVEDVTAEIKKWEEQKQNDLRKLVALVRKIIDLAKLCGGKAVLRYDAGKDNLVVCEVEAQDMLPKDLYLKWGDDQDHKVVTTTDDQKDGVEGSEKNRTVPEKHSEEEDAKASSETTIKIGDVKYNIPLSKIPYLASFVQQQRTANPKVTEFIHPPIPLFNVALEGIKTGYRECFRSLSTDLSQYQTLFETYKLLEVDILEGLSLDEVIANLKMGKTDYDPEERRSISGNKRLARDTAFQLLFLILHAQLKDEKKESMKLFDAVLFVVSHPGTFKHRAKRVIRTAYEQRFSPTIKQKGRLDQWNKGETADCSVEVSTEEEVDCYWSDSDEYFF